MKSFLKFSLIIIFIVTAGFRVFADELSDDNIIDSQQAVEIALAADLSLQAAKLNMEVAQRDYETAKRILSLGGSYSIATTSSGDWSDPTGSLGANSSGIYDTTSDHSYSKWYITYKSTDQDTYSYDLSYSPFKLGYEKNIKIKELEYINQSLTYENTRIGLIVEVRKAYAEAYQKREIYKMALQDSELVKKQYARAANLYNLGKISHLDLLDAQQKMKATDVKMRQADLNQQAGSLKLSVLLQKDDLQAVNLDGAALGWAAVDKIDLQATIEQRLKNNLNIKAASISIRIAKIQDLMDSFYLLKNVYIFAGERRTNVYDTTYYGLGFSGTLDDSYFRDKNTAEKRLKAAEINLEVAIRDKRAKILEAYRNWQIDELNLIPARESLEIAKERLRIANQKYERGMASGPEMDQVNLTFNNAEETYWEAWLSLQKAREEFYRAVDGGPVLK